MFGVGPAELLILLALGLPLVAVAIGFAIFVAKANKTDEHQQVPSYNELKVDNDRLRQENAELRENTL